MIVRERIPRPVDAPRAPPATAASLLPHGSVLRPGNRVGILRDGAEAFPAMLDAIRSARESIHFETYIFRTDRIGQAFAEALAERSRAGVSVRVLYDWLGSLFITSGFLEGMAEAGIQVIAFRSPHPWRRRWSLHRRDHQKIVVVDGNVAFIGGLNIGEEYAPAKEGGGEWHDLHARITGPAIWDLDRVFRRTWLRAGGDPFPVPPVPEPVAGDGALVLTVDNLGFRARSRMRRLWLHVLVRARREVCILNSYFIPDRVIRRALYRAVERGVSVRIIVPAVSDVPAVRHASRHLFGRLLRRGIRLFEWPDRMMHAKAAAIDGVWSTVGSYNIDHRSFFHNLEVGIVALDAGLAAEVQGIFEADCRRCREVRLEDWTGRPLREKLLDWLCFRIRRWM